MTSKRKLQTEPERTAQLQSKIFRLSREACRAFDVLKAEEGPRAGPRLAAEMVDLLLRQHGKQPVGPLRHGAASKGTDARPKA